MAARVCSLCWRKGNKQTELQQCRAKKSCNNKLTTSAVMRSLASKRVASRWTLLRLISRSASSSLQRKKNAPIALAAQLLDQDIELVLDDTDGAGADLHEAEPAGFDEAQRGVGKISLEVFFRPMSLMSYMRSSSKGPNHRNWCSTWTRLPIPSFFPRARRAGMPPQLCRQPHARGRITPRIRMLQENAEQRADRARAGAHHARQQDEQQQTVA